MQKVTFGTWEGELPENWEEVRKEDIPQLLDCVYFRGDSGESRLEIARLLMQLSKRAFKRFIQQYFGRKVSLQNRQQNLIVLNDFVRQANFLWVQDLTVLPFEHLTPGPSPAGEGRKKWVLPDAALSAMSYGELTDAYIHLQAYVKQLVKGEERLNLLVATLCRPERNPNLIKQPDWDGDYRLSYNEFECKARATIAASLPLETRLQVLIFFSAALNRKLSGYSLYTGSGSGDGEEYPGQSFVKNTHHLAAKGVYTSVRDVKISNADEVLLSLHELRADAEAERKLQEEL